MIIRFEFHPIFLKRFFIWKRFVINILFSMIFTPKFSFLKFTFFVNCKITDKIFSVDFSISNYTNPFNPSTTITFSITAKDAKNAKIMIYNVKGQKVKTFSNLKMNKSPNQKIVWDGKDMNQKKVASGIYLCKLQTGKYFSVKKITLLK